MLSNRNADLLKQEFKRRYLKDFAAYSTGLMEESGSHSANFLLICAALLGGSISLPLGGLLAVAVSARYAQVSADVKAALAEAGAAALAALDGEDPAALPHVERWLDAHLDDLPFYLDRQDSYEEDRRRARAVVRRVNRLGSIDGVTEEERRLLRRHGVKRLRPPLMLGYELTARTRIGNWHFTQLDRALWRDIAARAGGRGRMIGRILGLARG